MRKFCLAVSVSLLVILGLAAFSWAGEASVFDDVENVIIRAYTDGASSPYSVYLEVRDSLGNPVDSSAITVTGEPGTATPSNAGIPIGTGPCNASATGPTGCTAAYIIHNSDSIPPITSPNISLSLDRVTGTTHLFCTDTGTMHMEYSIINANHPVATSGQCGPANGGSFSQMPSANLCIEGSTASTPSGSGPWFWVCSGTNGGSIAVCTANLIINGSCGTAINGGPYTSAPASALCSSGNASTVTASSASYTWSCVGSYGGGTVPCSVSRSYTVTPSVGSNGSITPNSNQTVLYNHTVQFTIKPASSYYVITPVGGTCGGSYTGDPNSSTSGITYTTNNVAADCGVSATFARIPVNGVCGGSNGTGPFTSQPTDLCSVGASSTPINDGVGHWNWSCTGQYNGSTATCSATAPANGKCGSASGQSFPSAPTANLCDFTSSTPTVSGSGPWTWTCYGVNTGSNASCSADLQALPDLQGTVKGTTGAVNGYTWQETVYIKNAGSVRATGHFVVKMWRNLCAKLSCNNTGTVDAVLVKTWDSVADGHITGLDAYTTCQTSTNCPAGTYPALKVTFGPFDTRGMSVHTQYYLIVTVDSDNEITESDETNNTATWPLFMQ